ncbi:hypothetical protein [Tabrizicola sp.]|uniref:hypothetical protein n=1 Tax=Tabrizicola sp. TaxID=2005166 RepID=UPI003F2FC574
MATGAGLGNLIPVAMSLVGIVTILRARAKRRRGEPEVDQGFEQRQAAAAEMERRMASYLAGRQSGGWDEAPDAPSDSAESATQRSDRRA